MSQVEWLRGLAAKGGKGVVSNIDARSLGRIADEIERLLEQSRLGDAAIELLAGERDDYKMRWLGSMTTRDAQLIRGENERLKAALKRLDAVMDFDSPADTCACFPQGADNLNAAMKQAREALDGEQDANK